MQINAVSPSVDEAQPSQTHRLIADVSATLLRMNANEMVTVVEDALARVGEALEADRCTLIDYSRSGATDTSYHWTRLGRTVSDPAEDVAVIKAFWDGSAEERDVVSFERLPDDLPEEARAVIAAESGPHMTMTSAMLARTTTVEGEDPTTTALMVGAVAEYRCWPEAFGEYLRALVGLFSAALARCRRERALEETRSEMAQLRARLEGPSSSSAAPRVIEGFEQIVGNSPALRTSLAMLQEVAMTDSTVLLLGETGTGKELFAKALHARSPRRRFSIVSVNCAALPPTLIESELFGHERGAFTDALTQRQGRFELAHQGTLFLDEIGDLPLELQAKLLRVLQEGEFERVGASKTRKVDVRIVAATHRDLRRAVSQGEFREDLYYRLNVFPIRVPPLRERREDIPALVWATIQRRQQAMRRNVSRVPQAVMERLQRYDWPGNVRQLENVIERALIHSAGDTLVLGSGDIEEAASSESEDTTSLSSVERVHIEKVLRECSWRINGVGNAAERLGMHPNTLRFRMQKLGITRAQPAPAPPPRHGAAHGR